MTCFSTEISEVNLRIILMKMIIPTHFIILDNLKPTHQATIYLEFLMNERLVGFYLAFKMIINLMGMNHSNHSQLEIYHNLQLQYRKGK